MLHYLDLACEQATREHLWLTKACLFEAIVEGATKRPRPKFMTFATMIHRVGSNPMVYRNCLRDYEAHRSSDGGWDRHFLLVYPAITRFGGNDT